MRLWSRVAGLGAFLTVSLLASAAWASARTVTIRVWAQANNVEVHRAHNIEAAAERLNARLAEEGSDLRVEVEAVIDDTGWEDYKRRFLFAADSGNAPDIILSGHEDIAPWAASGYIIPLSDRIEAAWATVYSNVFENLWPAVEWKGERWGVPQDTEARPMFFNKKKLAELGWSEADIAALPDRIRRGE
ncbi:MAG TPA: extracellular solute-binding protein, partial [Limnochordia bacterium]